MAASETTLEARIQYLEDRQELWDLVAKYSIYVDDRDFEALGTQFTEDVRFQSGTAGWQEGREACMVYFYDRFEVYGPGYHYPHTQLVEFEDLNNARGVVTHHAEMSIDGETYWCAYRYIDRYRRENGVWLFSERAGEFLYLMPLAELATSLGDPLRKRWPNVEPAKAELPESKASWHRYMENRAAAKTI